MPKAVPAETAATELSNPGKSPEEPETRDVPSSIETTLTFGNSLDYLTPGWAKTAVRRPL